MIRVGPAGWSYADWEGRVYPSLKPRDFHPLSFLARYFDTVEINSTFYAMPRAEHARAWVQRVADRPAFRFLVKLNQEFTHAVDDDGEDPSRAWSALARQFLEGLDPLRKAHKLSALLAQFPVGFAFGAREVRRLGRLKASFPDAPLVLEVRHASWFAPPALDAVRGLSYSLAYVDLPPAWNHPPPWHAPTGPIGYLRLHGRNGAAWARRGATRDERYDYLYDHEEIAALARTAERIDAEHAETNVVTNNHYAGKAVANALEVLSLLRGEAVAAPAEIVEAFPHLRSHVRVDGQQPLF